jgi:replicative DNA helicase
MLHSAIGSVEDTIIPIGEAVQRHFDELEANMPRHRPQWVPTGLREMDNLLEGLRRRRVYVCGARTHMGKTSLALTVAVNAARLGIVPLLITMEESGGDVTNRMLALDMQVAVDRLGRGTLSPEEYSRYVEVAGRVGTLRAFIDAVPSITPRGLLQHAESYVRNQNVGLIIIDYLQLMSAGPLDANGEYEKLLYISRQLPKIAHRLNVPIWVNAQIHREVERRNDKRPMLFDFEGCGKIEQSADVALMLYRDSFYNEATAFPELVEVIVRKNKVNGKLGVANLRFDMESTRFSDWARTVNLPDTEKHWSD